MNNKLEAAVKGVVAAWDRVKCQVAPLDTMEVNRAMQALEDALKPDKDGKLIERFWGGVCHTCQCQVVVEHWTGSNTGRRWWIVACQKCKVQGVDADKNEAVRKFVKAVDEKEGEDR